MAHSDPHMDDTTASGAGSSMPVAPQYRAEPVTAASVDRPSSVTRAVQLMYVGAALSVVGIIVAWATRSQLSDQLAAASPTLSPDDVESATTISLAFATVVGLVGVGLWLWMAAANGAGKSWARVLATVFGGLGVLSSVYSLTTGTGITIAMQVVSLVLAVTILVLLWRPASSEYFRARSAPQV
ncbi:hypothetical protein [Cellulomonas sp. Leaf334]|uniref:hypothetical protein n=1 Tax=Cellulomonas sp. Leaf334 TaxID=1736339 RepID=UPI0007002609|nr:hypothetical protein [Cellulomonas sp. Leaf334]KQR11910.1 hypothetical protein ASF78_11965 [Cellulomonas sp. Leaf334]